MNPSEIYRFHRLRAICCDAELARFDSLDRAPIKLVREAVELGWVLTRNGDWVCGEHRQEAE